MNNFKILKVHKKAWIKTIKLKIHMKFPWSNKTQTERIFTKWEICKSNVDKHNYAKYTYNIIHIITLIDCGELNWRWSLIWNVVSLLFSSLTIKIVIFNTIEEPSLFCPWPFWMNNDFFIQKSTQLYLLLSLSYSIPLTNHSC